MTKKNAQCIFYQAESYNPEDSVGYLMRQILNQVGNEVERQLAHADLTKAQWVPLFKLYMCKTSTVAELAACCSSSAVSRPALTRSCTSCCMRVRCSSVRCASASCSWLRTSWK